MRYGGTGVVWCDVVRGVGEKDDDYFLLFLSLRISTYRQSAAHDRCHAHCRACLAGHVEATRAAGRGGAEGGHEQRTIWISRLWLVRCVMRLSPSPCSCPSHCHCHGCQLGGCLLLVLVRQQIDHPSSRHRIHGYRRGRRRGKCRHRRKRRHRRRHRHRGRRRRRLRRRHSDRHRRRHSRIDRGISRKHRRHEPWGWRWYRGRF